MDLHPTEPWILSSLYSGSFCIWNYLTQCLTAVPQGREDSGPDPVTTAGNAGQEILRGMDSKGQANGGRMALTDVTNNITALQITPSDGVLRKKEETNRKQREYRARKKAEANNPYHDESVNAQVGKVPDEKTIERNKKRRENCAMKKIDSNTVDNSVIMCTPTQTRTTFLYNQNESDDARQSGMT
uniref:Uncharacterized protein n=1 Tax=Leersia perrieri TaxID=77586 RepID=A0A0D9XU73_9ORYZ